MQLPVRARGPSSAASGQARGRKAVVARAAHQSTTDTEQQQQQQQLTRRDMSLVMVAAAAAALPHAAAAAPGDWTSPGLNSPVDPSLPKFIKTESGLKIQDVVVGTGASPQPGDTVLIDYVLRRANGYFIYSTAEGVSFQPRDVPIGPVAFKVGQAAEWIPGLQEAVLRMKAGGRSRVLIPPSQGYSDCGRDQPQPPTFATKRQLANHCKEPLLFELALLRVTPST